MEGRERQRRAALDLLLGEPGEPGDDGRVPPPGGIFRDKVVYQVACAVGVPGGDRVLDRPVGVLVLDEPGAGAPVEIWLHLGLDSVEIPHQGGAQQAVETEPATLSVQRVDQEERPGQLCQDRFRARLVENRVAELTGEAIEDRDPPHESQLLGRQPRGELVLYVLGDDPVVPGEFGYPAHRALAFDHREAGEVDRHRPPLGLLRHRADLIGIDRHPDLLEQRPNLGPVHGQLRHAQLQRSAVGTETAEVEMRGRPSRQSKLRTGRHSFADRFDHLRGLLGVEHVGVVDHQHELRRRPSERVQ